MRCTLLNSGRGSRRYHIHVPNLFLPIFYEPTAVYLRVVYTVLSHDYTRVCVCIYIYININNTQEKKFLWDGVSVSKRTMPNILLPRPSAKNRRSRCFKRNKQRSEDEFLTYTNTSPALRYLRFLHRR